MNGLIEFIGVYIFEHFCDDAKVVKSSESSMTDSLESDSERACMFPLIFKVVHVGCVGGIGLTLDPIFLAVYPVNIES